MAPIAVTCLSNDFHTEDVLPENDHIASLMDDEWNQKLLELLAIGRLEDVAQLARTFSSQVYADNKLKAIWWLSAVMGQHNRYTGDVLEYQPVLGTEVRLFLSLRPNKRLEVIDLMKIMWSFMVEIVKYWL